MRELIWPGDWILLGCGLLLFLVMFAVMREMHVRDRMRDEVKTTHKRES
jgi:hypothetical protein